MGHEDWLGGGVCYEGSPFFHLPLIHIACCLQLKQKIDQTLAFVVKVLQFHITHIHVPFYIHLVMVEANISECSLNYFLMAPVLVIIIE